MASNEQRWRLEHEKSCKALLRRPNGNERQLKDFTYDQVYVLGIPVWLQYGESMGRINQEDQLNKIIVVTQVRNVVA